MAKHKKVNRDEEKKQRNSNAMLIEWGNIMHVVVVIAQFKFFFVSLHPHRMHVNLNRQKLFLKITYSCNESQELSYWNGSFLLLQEPQLLFLLFCFHVWTVDSLRLGIFCFWHFNERQKKQLAEWNENNFKVRLWSE